MDARVGVKTGRRFEGSTARRRLHDDPAGQMFPPRLVRRHKGERLWLVAEPRSGQALKLLDGGLNATPNNEVGAVFPSVPTAYRVEISDFKCSVWREHAFVGGVVEYLAGG